MSLQFKVNTLIAEARKRQSAVGALSTRVGHVNDMGLTAEGSKQALRIKQAYECLGDAVDAIEYAIHKLEKAKAGI